MCNFQVTYVGCADFPVFLFLIEGIKCLIPCDFAPGLSLPYPSIKLITPHTPSPAPMATTRVCKILIAELKNAICDIETVDFQALSTESLLSKFSIFEPYFV